MGRPTAPVLASYLEELYGRVAGQLPGCAIGLIGAIVVGPAVRSLLFGITPSDPQTLLFATALLLAAVTAGG